MFDAAALIYITIHAESPLWAVYDAGAFGQSLMLSAFGHGIDSVPAYEIVKYPKYIHEIMEIPEDEQIVMGIGLGMSSENKINQFRSDREDIKRVLEIKD